jgi:hypothetical protein
MKKNTLSYRIDTRWCLDELLKEGRISQRDANLVATTAAYPRQTALASITNDCSI